MSTHHSDSEVMEELESSTVATNDKVHSWRICPIGKHFVRTHVLHIPPSQEHPNGQLVTRHEHCAENPSRKDMLSYDEIQVIDKTYFSHLIGSPKMGVLKFPKADEFDQQIRGWTQYWNEIFSNEKSLDPNLVKALIASESGFKYEQITPQSNPGKTSRLGYARGLMQLTDSTLKIISDHKGEMGNYFIDLTHEEALDPSANICAGVRWLFLKKKAAAARLHHPASWDDAVAEYKGLLKRIIDSKGTVPKEMEIFHFYYNQFLE